MLLTRKAENINPDLIFSAFLVNNIYRPNFIILVGGIDPQFVFICPILNYGINFLVAHLNGTPGTKFSSGILFNSSNCSRPPRLPKAGRALDLCNLVPAGTRTCCINSASVPEGKAQRSNAGCPFLGLTLVRKPPVLLSPENTL